MSDLINRRAALDTIMGQPPEPHYPSWYAAQIEELPAVQPELDCALKEFGNCSYSETGCADCEVKARIRNALTAQPEIIRCKDCRFNDGTAYCLFHFRDVKGEGFCLWAERRTDG